MPERELFVETVCEKMVIGDDEIDITLSCLPSSEELCKNQTLLCAHLTFAQRTIHVGNYTKTRVFFHHKPFPLEINTIGDLLMVRRKQARFTHKQLTAKTGIRLHWIRRFEFDRCLPPQPEWDLLRKFLKLPPKPILTFTQLEKPLHRPKTIGERLRKRRLELKLCLAEAAPRMGVSIPTLGLWELGKAFPKHCYHTQIAASLGCDLFS
jgi:transcriptional regulator with XRE-family HTH domain